MPNERQLKYYEIRSNSSRDDMLKRTELTPNDYAKVYDSTALVKYDLTPEYILELDDIIILVSRIFNVRFEERPHVVLYIENSKGGFIARNFYRSRSQGVWRFLPGVFNDGWFYKSPYGEQAINAPIELQKVLDELHGVYLERFIQNTGAFPPRGIGGFGGDDTKNFDVAFKTETQERQWMGFMVKTTRSVLGAPKELILNSEDSPDFSRELMSWQDVDGNAKRVFMSRNGQLKYEFLTNKKGASCLALIECANTKINSFGLHNQFVQTGDFTTPLYEYRRQTKGAETIYGDLDDCFSDSYCGMWRKYLSQIPVIREYTDFLRNQGCSVADYDDIAGQIEEDAICEIIRKIITNEHLTAREKEYICRTSNQFAYPETAKNAQENLRRLIPKREVLKVRFLDNGRIDARSLARRIMLNY